MHLGDNFWFLRTYEDILDREAVQPHKSKTILRTLGGASRIYGTHLILLHVISN
jgi:hypothetical protein